MKFIKPSYGACVDRLSILKLKRLLHGEDEDLLGEVEAINDYCLVRGWKLPENHPLYKDLFDTNRQIWRLTDEVRDWRKEGWPKSRMRMIERCELMVKILELNDHRADLVRRVDSGVRG